MNLQVGSLFCLYLYAYAGCHGSWMYKYNDVMKCIIIERILFFNWDLALPD